MKVFILVSSTLLVIFMFDKIKCERRIINGNKISGAPKRYMAYLVKAPISPRHYDAWMCGGTIVHASFILTSAACVEDIEYMYAIAGYEKYVPASKIEEDECTKSVKKKVIFVCTPKMYQLDYAKIEKWANVDIAAVKVESPYIFSSLTPSLGCTWVPDMIEISFEYKHQTADTDVMVLGWGHTRIWRTPTDQTDYNQEILQYAPTLILDKTVCKSTYQSAQPTLPSIIDKYMICTLGEGNIDESGRIISKTPPNLDGCGDPSKGIIGNNNNNDNNNNNNKDCIPKIHMGDSMPWASYNFYNFKRRTNTEINETETEFPHISRRNGICQNDHGGPLVTWVGGREVLIGVASVFLVDAKDRKCVGPYLHTSTQCNGAFLNCVLKMFDGNTTTTKYDKNKTRRFYEPPEMAQDRRNREDVIQRYRYMVMMSGAMCELPSAEKGFEMVKRRISWLHHPDGPAQNEIEDELIDRPQIPLNSYLKT